MITKLRLIILSLLSAFTLVSLSAAPVLAVDCNSGSLSAKDAVLCGGAGGNQGQIPSDATGKFNAILSDILNFMTVLAGITAVVMVITAGFRFVTSGGNPDRVKSARSALVYAIIGIAIVALSQIIVQFVLAKATKTPPATGEASIAMIAENS